MESRWSSVLNSSSADRPVSRAGPGTAPQPLSPPQLSPGRQVTLIHTGDIMTPGSPCNYAARHRAMEGGVAGMIQSSSMRKISTECKYVHACASHDRSLLSTP